MASPERRRAISASTIGGLDADEARLGDVGRIVAAHHVVDGALHGHLGQMRDHDHLMSARQVCEHLREGVGRGAANAGVDLVEHECVDGVRLAEDHLGSEHDARARHRWRCGAADEASCRHRCGRAAHKRLDPGAVQRSRGSGLLSHTSSRDPSRDAPSLAHLAAKTRRRSVPALGQRPSGFGKLGLGGIAGIAGSPHAGLGVIDERKQLSRLIAAGKDVLLICGPHCRSKPLNAE